MRFTIPRDIYYGENSLDQLKSWKGKKAVVITGGSSMQENGFLDRAKENLEEAGLQTVVFSGVEQDPGVKTVMRGADFLKKEEPDWILALGGGSAIDAAKIMWLFYEHPELTFEEAKKGGKLPGLREKARFVAIPSTSGTASEVTSFAVITDEETGMKYPLADYEITPDAAILDPALAKTMPASLIAQTGMDALTHAIEGYVATGASDFTDPLALAAIETIVHNLVQSYRGDLQARERVHYAQCLAGMCFTNALLGIAHSLAHKTGQIFHIPHGMANAIYLPYVILYNGEEPGTCDRYSRISRALGVKADDDKTLTHKLAEFVRTMCHSMEIPLSLREYGISEAEFQEKVDEIAHQAAKDPCTGSNPRRAEEEDLRKLLCKIYEGDFK